MLMKQKPGNRADDGRAAELGSESSQFEII